MLSFWVLQRDESARLHHPSRIDLVFGTYCCSARSYDRAERVTFPLYKTAPSAAPARRSTRITFLAGAVPHHGEVLALRAHVAGVALHHRDLAAFGGERLGVRHLLGGGVGEERRGG